MEFIQQLEGAPATYDAVDHPPPPTPPVDGTKPEGQANGAATTNAAAAAAADALERAALRIHHDLSVLDRTRGGGGGGGGDGTDAAEAAAGGGQVDDAMEKANTDDILDTQAPLNLQSIMASTLKCITTHFPPNAPSGKSTQAQIRATKSLYDSLLRIAQQALDGDYSSLPSLLPSSSSSASAATGPGVSLKQASHLLLTAATSERSTLPRFLSFKQQIDLFTRASRLSSLHTLYLKGPTPSLPPFLPPFLPPHHLSLLNDVCLEKFRELAPPPQRMAQVEEARERLERVLHQHPPFMACRVMVFGSAFCCLGTSKR